MRHLNLNPKLKEILDIIVDPTLRRKVEKVVLEPTIIVEGETRRGLSLEDSPAGKSRHHSYGGGLLQHIVSTTRIALALCDVVEEIYGGSVNRDVVVSAVLLHDVMKPITYVERDEGSFDYSLLGERLDHLSMVTAELYRQGFELDVIHAVVSHHGEASPLRPRTLESLIVHLADVADSRLNGDVLSAARYLIRKTTGEEIVRLTAEEAFRILHAKTRRGEEGVREAWRDLRKA